MSNGGYLRKSRTPVPPPAVERPQSFSERLASVRADDAQRAQRNESIRKLRSKVFDMGQAEMERYKSEAVDLPEELEQAPTFSREEILGKATPSGLKRSNTAAGQDTSGAAGTAPSSQGPASFEAYSGFHLSRRTLPHNVLARHMSGKQAFCIKDLLRDVKAPDFALPDIEQDIVVLGIVAKKSDPRLHKQGAHNKDEPPRKFMVITLVDLHYELELFLFNSGFERFWKLTEGTVVAILNPDLMPPPKGREHTGKFSLVINSDEDTIIEVGKSRDLGFCQSVKKSGDTCGVWVNKKRTNFCEYHTNEAVRKQRGNRMEVNTAGFSGRKLNSREVWLREKRMTGKEHAKATNYDRDTSSTWFVSRSMSAADLIDGKDMTALDKRERALSVKRKLVAQEKEREIMQKLKKVGGGAGREYMQAAIAKRDENLAPAPSRPTSAFTIPAGSSQPFIEPRDRDRAIHLGPLKRKRTDSALSGLTSTSTSRSSGLSSAPKTSALGWGGNLKDKLSRMKEGEKLRKEEERKPSQQRTISPVRKKTRFVTEKGIREAGRESLGNELAGRRLAFDDDDDDELVIV